MFKLVQIGKLAVKTIRPNVNFHLQTHLQNRRLLIPSHRFYSKKKDDKVYRKTEPLKEVNKCKVNLGDCKPTDHKTCKLPQTSPCERKAIPSLQECTKPNLMSELPKPDCAWEEAERKRRQRNRLILLLGILLLTVSSGIAYIILNRKQPKGVLRKKGKQAVKEKGKKRVPVRCPENGKEIPAEIPYLLIGGGTAAFSAFRAIKSADPLAKVLVVTEDGFYPYMRPPLSKEIWYNSDPELIKKYEFKQWNGSQRSLFYEPNDFYVECKNLLASPNGGVSVARGWSISHIDVVNREAYITDAHPIKYDKCLIATGAIPKSLDVFDEADEKVKENVTVYRDIYDFEHLYENIGHTRDLAIVGGGFLGSELASAIGTMCKDDKQFNVYQIFKEEGNLAKVLPEYLSAWTTEKVKAMGVEVMADTEVLQAMPDSGRVKLRLSNGSELVVDQIVLAVGVEANTKLAEKSDLEVDPDLGGYLVNTELQARSNLYIAGDCACFYDVKLGRRRVEHHDHAVVTGRLAGENMTGSAKPYLHQSMFWSDIGPDVGFEAIGIVDSTLPTVGVFAKACDKDSPKALVSTSSEGLRASSEEEIPEDCKQYASKEKVDASNKAKEKRKVESKPHTGEDFGKGIIFYLRDEIVVGILMWNVFNRMQIARQVLLDERKYDDLNEVAKLFNIHEE